MVDLGQDAPTADDAPTQGHRKERGFFRRHKVGVILGTFGVLVLALLVGAGIWLVVINNKLDDIPRYDSKFGDRDNRPPRTAPEGALNILLVGVDGRGEDVRQRIQDGDTGILSDTMMIWHLSEDHQTSQIVSIPRDSWVPIPDHGTAKMNAAFSWGGPDLLVATLEDDLGVFIDHVAIVDFDGFRDITKTLGGVEIKMADGSTQNLEGEDALAYVRERHSLPRGDFDRINRQQNFLREVLHEVTRNSTRANPFTMTNLIGDLSSLLLLDDDWTNGDLRSLGLELARKGAGKIDWMTAPTNGTGTSSDGQSIVNLDIPKTTALFAAISKDDFADYKKDHPVAFLPKPENVL